MQKENIALMPIDLKIRDGHYFVVSAKLPRENFKEPFFLDSLLHRFHLADVNKNRPEEQDVLVRPLHYDENDPRIELIPLDDFIHAFDEKIIDENKLKFIFHMSRCGSTLATQMLATADRFFVVSEPPIINALLDPALLLPDGYSKMELLKTIISAIESCKPEYAEFTFIKFRSWNTLFLDKILEQFPKTEWMFVHRNGLEVLESVLRDPPGWLRSRHTYETFLFHYFGLSLDELKQLDDDEYAIRVLGTFCKIALEQKSSRALYVDYDQIVENLPGILERMWKLNLSTLEKESMFASTKVYSKDPKKTKKFEPDGEKKRQLANDTERELVEKYIETQRAKLNKQSYI